MDKYAIDNLMITRGDDTLSMRFYIMGKWDEWVTRQWLLLTDIDGDPFQARVYSFLRLNGSHSIGRQCMYITTGVTDNGSREL